MDNNKDNKVPWKTTISYTDTIIVEGATFASSKEDAEEKLQEVFKDVSNFEILSVAEMSDEDMMLLQSVMEENLYDEEDTEVLH